ncbi:MAG: hydroxyacylglutathione hydrolase [Hyphomonadaceae bacterium]|nr:hydroxyacylglutathione hydrolase [Hyphomonadaceae bacterium]MBC6413138.1 hydroxyacylglutathione hydrolase [Hyphomonadaceae bacterium]
MAQDLIIDMFPCLQDNYGFLIHNPATGSTATVDTPEAEKIAARCRARGWTLTHIWNTHHHWDHTGGNIPLLSEFDVDIIGPERDKKRIPGMTQGVEEGDRFYFGDHVVEVIETPGHTIGHIAFYIPSAGAAFVGDTIFVAGCGRLFEGSPEDMFGSLAKLVGLPDDTKLYCAHEYTLSNGYFAVTVEPENSDLADYMAKARKLREDGQPTVPTTVAQEKKINPFVRAVSAEELGKRRAAKDNF